MVCNENLYIFLQAILDIVVNLQFNVIEVLWQSFWRNTPDEDQTQEK